MKTVVQKYPLEENCSIIAHTFQTPHFETPYHQHVEYELIAIKNGNGTVFIGDNISKYQAGDVYLIGNNMPHWFKKESPDIINDSMVVLFKEDFLGNNFFETPEMSSIKNLLISSARGIKLNKKLQNKITRKLILLENQLAYDKIIGLLNILQEISLSHQTNFVSSLNNIENSIEDQFLINLVFEFSEENFKRKISLDEVASLTNKSVSAFCHYFKKTTKMSYIKFLTQLRLKHASQLLKNTNYTVTRICYDSGFFNWANFSKHFKEYYKVSPSQYRHNFRKI